MQSPSLDQQDILIEILTRLPLKSFSRSKCVSKSWSHLLSDTYVRNKLPLIIAGIFQIGHIPTYASTSDENFDLSFAPFRSNSTLIDCCNGLLLFYSSLTSSFHVCNPTTKKHATLPKPTNPSQLSILAFDPYRSRHFLVVNFARWQPRGAVLEIFRSESGGWTEHELRWGVGTDALTPTMHYADGILYVLALPRRMVVVDLDHVTCHVVELPENTDNRCCVGKLGGGVCYSKSDGDRLRVWELGGDKEWKLKYCVGMRLMGKYYKVLGFHPEKDVVYVLVGEKLVGYDLCEEEMEEICLEVGKKDIEKGNLVQVWAFSFGKNLEDCLADAKR